MFGDELKMLVRCVVSLLTVLSCATLDGQQSLMQNTCMCHTLGMNVAQYARMTDCCQWTGVKCADGEVVHIHWDACQRLIISSVCWLPPTVLQLHVAHCPVSSQALITSRLPRALRSCVVMNCRMEGSIELRTLPNHIEVLKLMQNKFSGKIRITQLPSTAVEIDLTWNKIRTVFLWNACLPEHLRYIKVGCSREGTQIIGLDGPPDDRVFSRPRKEIVAHAAST
ncbi:leucine-rich repeat protein [Perkinsela sp. CCAP 1560/4]|nr:leucine-rich repeat protein [Perkinsela sp. CCAP 1560/4]|eukprot:KNH03881.1 leucine-rich repeat protein [Perkinsela sp. CCAP 1560/4]